MSKVKVPGMLIEVVAEVEDHLFLLVVGEYGKFQMEKVFNVKQATIQKRLKQNVKSKTNHEETVRDMLMTTFIHKPPKSDPFLKFCKKEMSSESLVAYRICTNLKKKQNDFKGYKKELDLLFDTYIADNCEQPLNIEKPTKFKTAYYLAPLLVGHKVKVLKKYTTKLSRSIEVGPFALFKETQEYAAKRNNSSSWWLSKPIGFKKFDAFMVKWENDMNLLRVLVKMETLDLVKYMEAYHSITSDIKVNKLKFVSIGVNPRTFVKEKIKFTGDLENTIKEHNLDIKLLPSN